MSERINCPGCQRALRLPRECTSLWVTCPRCRARFRNPQAGGGAEEAEDTGRSCSSCGTDLEPPWLDCPHCQESWQAPQEPSLWEAEDAFRPERGFLRSVGFALAVSGFPVGVLLIVVLVYGLVSRMDEKAQGPMFIFFGLLFGLCFVCGIIAGLREAYSKRRGRASPPSLTREEEIADRGERGPENAGSFPAGASVESWVLPCFPDENSLAVPQSPPRMVGEEAFRKKGRRLEPILTGMAGVLSGGGVLIGVGCSSLAWWRNESVLLINTLILLFVLAIASTWILLARRVNPRGPHAGMIFVGVQFLGAILLMEGFAMIGGILVFTTAVCLLVGVALGLPADGESDRQSPFHPLHRT